MKNQKGVSLIALIITIIVIIILAAIVMVSSSGTIDEGNFAGYAQELGDYTSAVTTSTSSIKADAAVEGIILNNAQANYMLANGVSAADVSGDENVMGKVVPKGTTMTETVLTALNYTKDDAKLIAAYEIKDDTKVDGYRTPMVFYGDSNGDETHFVTSDGTVFTLPGFPRTQEDGTIRYYITPTGYYTVKGNPKGEAKWDETLPIQKAMSGDFAAISAIGE